MGVDASLRKLNTCVKQYPRQTSGCVPNIRKYEGVKTLFLK
jgi:hypothetical protein